MVGNEEQWDDMEYSDQENDSYYEDDANAEYSEEDYDNGYENEEYEDESAGAGRYSAGSSRQDFSKPKSSKLPLIVILLLLLGVGGFFAVSKLSNGGDVAKDEGIAQEQQDDDMVSASFDDNGNDMLTGDSENQPQNSDNNENMMDFSFDESSGNNADTSSNEGNSVATVQDANNSGEAMNLASGEQQQDETNNDIIVSYDKPLKNPFKPYNSKPVQDDKSEKVAALSLPKADFEIIEPPLEPISDPNLNRLLSTQISGILYDDVSPSAIVNLNGVDTFVKVGDTINGYTINSITRNYVQISYKDNTYVASVGELFARGVVNRPAVANIEKKFAGRYK